MVYVDPTYGLRIEADAQPSPFQVELFCYRHGIGPDQGGLGRAGHFKRIVEMLWGPKSPKHFVWHPWAEKMNEVCHEHPITKSPYPHVGISGCGSSGKTDFGAVYGLVNWLVDPKNTLILCTSTDLKASRKRIWGSIVQYYQPIAGGCPAKLVDSMGIIRTDDGSGIFNDKSGVALIAGEKKKEKEAIGKLIGSKNKRVILLADELCELTEAILDAAFSNLTTNPFFQMVAFANFKSRYDPFGIFAEPINGYDSITVEDQEWETRRGWALHFDGLKSPNILAGKDEWPIYGSKQLAAHRKDLGPDSALFWRMCRSFESPLGIDDVIYSESDLAVGRASAEPVWYGEVTKLAAADPSYTNGGDRFILWLGKMGRVREGDTVLYFDRFLTLFDDATKSKERTRAFQMADKVKKECESYGVAPKNFGIDVTANGTQADVIEEVWGRGVYRVDFSGSATDRRFSALNPKTAKEQYWNRVSELWYVGLEFLKHGQLKGIKLDQAREMKARKYETIKGAEGLKIRVESKKDMKVRLGFSPDIADAGFVMLDLARQKGFRAGVETAIKQSDSFGKLAKDINKVYTGMRYAA